MRYYISLVAGTAIVGILLLLMGCSSATPDLGERAYADIGCISQLAASASGVIGDPVIAEGTHSGATAVQVLAAVHELGAANVSVQALLACKDTLTYAGQDVQKLNAAIKAKIDAQKSGK